MTITWLGPRGGSLATGRLTTTAPSKQTVHVVLTAAGRRFLRHHGRGGTVRVQATFLDAAGHHYQKAAKIKLAP